MISVFATRPRSHKIGTAHLRDPVQARAEAFRNHTERAISGAGSSIQCHRVLTPHISLFLRSLLRFFGSLLGEAGLFP
jgi:hypothetical protein